MITEPSEPSVVLLVDDNPTNLEILVKSLSAADYKVRVAQDGESAIAQVDYAKPDLILLDVMMPGLDGFQTCQRLKQNPATQAIPVVFMTALTEVFDKVHGFQMGAVDYITKPFEIEEVLIRIRTHLAIQTLQNQLRSQNLQLQAEIRERQKAEEAVQVFFHAVSHDLRNPVTGGLMVLHSLLQEAEATGNASISQSTLQRMIQSHDRQLTLINSLLEVHGNDVGGIALQRQPLHLAALIHDLAIEWEPQIKKQEASLHVDIAIDLPPVFADPNQLYRVYENLISNALKHNPPGITLTLSVAATSLADGRSLLCCTVQDNGIGIQPQESGSMFELYKRGNQARRTVGLGLGLYLCHQIITAHGGEIGVDSQPDNGSTFWFTLPSAPDPKGSAASQL